MRSIIVSDGLQTTAVYGETGVAGAQKIVSELGLQVRGEQYYF